MAGNITNTFILSQTAQEDSTSNVVINRTDTVSFDCTLADLKSFPSIGAGDNVIALPTAPTATPVTFLKVINKDAAKTITVKWTPNGGALATIIVLNPGDFICFGCNPAGATPGITSLTLNPSAGGALYEIFFGA